ncbi:MAG: hypothetical protein RIR00_180 [Pseudomonadota bacterium]|jgi:putative restriction endonuclease
MPTSQINQTDRARLAWNVLTHQASQKEPITYGELGQKIGIHHRAVRYALGPIQDYCLENNLPPLTILVINQTGKPGTGFIAHDTNDLRNGLSLVFNYPWKDEVNPFSFAESGFTYDQIIEHLIEKPAESAEIYFLTKSRGIQQTMFREAVRRAYNWQCAFTGWSFTDCLDACHIIPWEHADSQQRMDVRNGVLLNPLHHKLFDKGYITITENYTIKYCDPNEEKYDLSELERSLLINLHNKKMHLPQNKSLWPLKENIIYHNNFFE